MAHIELFDHLGQVAIDKIDPAAVAELSDDSQRLLKAAIDAVEIRTAAQDRFTRASIALRAAEAKQHEALARHVEVNAPQTPQQAHAAAVAAYQSSI